MKIKIIASGSKGNCYLLETEDGSLLLEAGIPINKIKGGESVGNLERYKKL